MAGRQTVERAAAKRAVRMGVPAIIFAQRQIALVVSALAVLGLTLVPVATAHASESSLTVSVMPPGGTFVTSPVRVTLSCPLPGAEIYYSFGPGELTRHRGRRYSGTPIAVRSHATIRARAYLQDGSAGPLAVSSYVVCTAKPRLTSTRKLGSLKDVSEEESLPADESSSSAEARLRVSGRWVDSGAPASQGAILVVYDRARLSTMLAKLGEQQADLGAIGDNARVALVRVPRGERVSRFASDLAQTPGVAWVQPNYQYRVASRPGDPRLAEQWGLEAVGVPSAWAHSSGTPSVTVAVVDSGVDMTHPELAASVDAARGIDFADFDDDPSDDLGHGTHVAGIIAASSDNGVGGAGVAPGCRILPVRVLNEFGFGTTLQVALGIVYAAESGAQIINLSLGGGNDPLMALAVEYAQSKGCLVVASAGNSARSIALFPARLPGVIGVGAVDRNLNRSWFSNYGFGTDIVGPGTAILSTLPRAEYAEYSGTSMSAPFVSGVAALVWSMHPDWSADRVAERLLTTAADLGGRGVDPYFGAGLVRADAALSGRRVSLQSVRIRYPLRNADVYYTTDGSLPTTLSARYGGPFDVIGPQTVRARALLGGSVWSPVGVASY